MRRETIREKKLLENVEFMGIFRSPIVICHKLASPGLKRV